MTHKIHIAMIARDRVSIEQRGCYESISDFGPINTGDTVEFESEAGPLESGIVTKIEPPSVDYNRHKLFWKEPNG